eukprot:880913-Prorocentrum_minimum.AAC.2
MERISPRSAASCASCRCPAAAPPPPAPFSALESASERSVSSTWRAPAEDRVREVGRGSRGDLSIKSRCP